MAPVMPHALLNLTVLRQVVKLLSFGADMHLGCFKQQVRPQLPLPPASLSGVWCAEGPANAHSVQLGRVIPLFSIVFRCSYFF